MHTLEFRFSDCSLVSHSLVCKRKLSPDRSKGRGAGNVGLRCLIISIIAFLKDSTSPLLFLGACSLRPNIMRSSPLSLVPI